MEILVFGSNTEGRHGAGVALIARQSYGAKYGQSKYLQGNSYAIVTKDLSKGKRSIPLEYIQEQINELDIFIGNNQQHSFLISPIGQGLAGYTVNEIAPMFNNIAAKYSNITFFKNWR